MHLSLAVAFATILRLLQLGPGYLYPNPLYTPGDIDKGATTKNICINGYTQIVRYVTDLTKDGVRAEYGYDRKQCNGKNCEIDHLIPLELGGSNSRLNLWPELKDTTISIDGKKVVMGFKQKDAVENYLHREVCAGRMKLEDAQEAIRADWYAVYLKMKANKKK